jgi:hypothetical protein
MTSELKTQVTNEELREIKTPRIIAIMKTIKAIQKRMKDPDLVKEDFITVITKLGEEFQDFADRYGLIFTKVVRGENLDMVASVLYYQDQVALGLITEEKLSDMLAEQYLPKHLKDEADAKIKEMKEQGIL